MKVENSECRCLKQLTLPAVIQNKNCDAPLRFFWCFAPPSGGLHQVFYVSWQKRVVNETATREAAYTNAQFVTEGEYFSLPEEKKIRSLIVSDKDFVSPTTKEITHWKRVRIYINPQTRVGYVVPDDIESLGQVDLIHGEKPPLSCFRCPYLRRNCCSMCLYTFEFSSIDLHTTETFDQSVLETPPLSDMWVDSVF